MAKVGSLRLSQLPADGTVPGFGLTFSWDNRQPVGSGVFGPAFQEFCAFHNAAWQPCRALSDVVRAGSAVGSLIGLNTSLRQQLDTLERVELRVQPEGLLLTDVLWEMAVASDGLAPAGREQQFDAALASLPFTRVVAGNGETPTLAESRPTILWCMSNEPLRHRQFDLASFVNVYERLRSSWPIFSIEQVPNGPNGRLTWAEASSGIVARQPTVLVLVAHGSSSPRSFGDRDPSGRPAPDEPSVLFQSSTSGATTWVPTRWIAQSLLRGGSTTLVILVCCDLTRTGGVLAGLAPASYSAARMMVTVGVPEVIAMQAPIHVAAASDFIHGFLADWLHNFRTECAAAAGRRTVIQGAEQGYCYLPTVFCSETSLGSTAMSDLAAKVQKAAAEATRLPAPRNGIVERSKLLKALEEELAKTGLVRIIAPIGAGATTLLAAAVRRFRRRPGMRPALYLDCSAAFPDPSASGRIISWLNEIQTKHAVLFASSKKGLLGPHVREICTENPDQLGKRVAQFVGDADLVVVLDNIQFPSDPDDQAFWAAFMSEALTMSSGLIVIAGEVPQIALNANKPHRIPNLDKTEFDSLLSSAAPNLDAKVSQEIFDRTEGNPLLIDAFMKVYSEEGLTKAMNDLNAGSERYAALVLRGLSDQAVSFLFRLATSDIPVPADSAVTHLFWDIPDDARQACINAGVVRENQVDHEVWWSLPTHLRRSLLALDPSLAEDAADAIVEHWGDPDDPFDKKLASLRQQRGGYNIAVCVAECHQQLGETDQAVQIADSVLQFDSPLLDKLRFARKASSWAMKADPAHARIHVAAANLALWTDRVGEVKEFLDRIPKGADAIIRIDALLVRARWLKDAHQHEGVEEADRVLADAERLINSEKARADSEALEWYRWQVRYEKLRLALFFGIAPNGEGIDLRSATIELAPSAGERARTLATIAEAEMKRGAGIDWEQVAEWTLEAARLAGDPAIDCGDRSFCVYQYARYLEERLSDPAEAIAQYSKVEELARQEDNPARGGLATFRRISLESRVFFADPIPNLPRIEVRLREIQQVLDGLGKSEAKSALAWRARVRLLEIAASLSFLLGAKDGQLDFLEQAVHAASTPLLLARSDMNRLLRLLSGFLEAAQRSAGTFRRQQCLLSAVRFGIRKRMQEVGVREPDLPIDQPADALQTIRKYMETLQNG